MVRDQTENLLIFTHKILHHHNVPVWFVFADRNNHTLTSQEDCDEMRKIRGILYGARDCSDENWMWVVMWCGVVWCGCSERDVSN